MLPAVSLHGLPVEPSCPGPQQTAGCDVSSLHESPLLFRKGLKGLEQLYSWRFRVDLAALLKKRRFYSHVRGPQVLSATTVVSRYCLLSMRSENLCSTFTLLEFLFL